MVEDPLLSSSPDFVIDEEIHKIAFGSCHKNKYADASVWQRLADEQPQAFVWTGDAVYPPVRDIATVKLVSTEYDQMLHNESIGYKQFVEATTKNTTAQLWGTYDDHDFGGNDRGHDMPDKQARALLFWNFLNSSRPYPMTGNTPRQGLYYSVVWPRSSVRLIVLDTRWFRQDHCIPSVAGKMPLGAGVACITRWLTAGLYPYSCGMTGGQPSDAMLGKEQWEWLDKQLSASPTGATDKGVDIIVSSVQVLTTNPAMESWGHFPEEQKRLLALLEASSRTTLLLSGDVHHGELSAAGSVLEATSSGLTHECSQQFPYGFICQPLLNAFNRHRYASRSNYYIGRNYGTIDVNNGGGGVRVNIHDASSGSVMLSALVKGINAAPATPCLDGHLWPVAWTLLVLLATGLTWRRRQR